jgi:ABC-type Fe3+/spermidine/putrescine transport system ATPase subunit
VTPTLRMLEVRAGYGPVTVLHGVDFDVAPAESVVMLGPSGSGKSTILNVAAGFLAVAAGRVEIGGRVVDGEGGRPVAPEHRSIGVVFQSHALWPHLSALDTVAYPLRRAGHAAAEARRMAGDLLERLGVGEVRDRRPGELSGGQQQRVGVARALARRPSLLLLDEPTANLDAPLRDVLQDEIRVLRAEAGVAALYATHDAAEALAVADRLVLVRDGRIVQGGPPVDVYERPVDLWAARLTGPATRLRGRAEAGGLVVGEVSVLPLGVPAAGGMWDLLVRPEWAVLGGPLAGVVESVAYRGAHTDVRLVTPAGEVLVRAPGRAATAPGDRPGWDLRRVWPLGPAGTASPTG